MANPAIGSQSGLLPTMPSCHSEAPTLVSASHPEPQQRGTLWYCHFRARGAPAQPLREGREPRHDWRPGEAPSTQGTELRCLESLLPSTARDQPLRIKNNPSSLNSIRGQVEPVNPSGESCPVGAWPRSVPAPSTRGDKQRREEHKLRGRDGPLSPAFGRLQQAEEGAGFRQNRGSSAAPRLRARRGASHVIGWGMFVSSWCVLS